MKFDIEQSYLLGKQKDLIQRIEKHVRAAYDDAPKEPPRRKDFYNLFDGTVTCGWCEKKISAFRALFHFHIV